jgi:hypothetical protein
VPRVKIDERFWTGVLKDYAHWVFAWVREVGQNSLDAGARNITAITTYSPEQDETCISWADDGCGMTRDILEDKFFALGGSNKGAANTSSIKKSIGGFGVAKQLLAFAHKRYSMRTGDMFVCGCHDEFEISLSRDFYKGTILTVYISGNRVSDFENNLRRWARRTLTDCNISMNGIKLTTCEPMGRRRASLDWCDIYVKDDDNERAILIVRINGQMMFARHIDNIAKVIYVDISDSDSSKYLTSNRDSLVYEFQNGLDKFLANLFRDPNKIIEAENERITFYEGRKGSLNMGAAKMIHISDPSLLNKAAKAALNLNAIFNGSPAPHGFHMDIDSKSSEHDFHVDGHDVVIINSLSKDTPDSWLPENMSEAKWTLLNRWNAILEICMTILERREVIRTGWIFSTRALALHKRDGDYGHLILLNPVRINGGRFISAWPDTREMFWQLVSTAVHEITHLDHSYHDEAYASSLTNNMAKVLANVNKLGLVK